MSQNLENKKIFTLVLGCYNPGKSITINRMFEVNVNFWESGFRPDENTKEKNELKRELLNLDGLYIITLIAGKPSLNAHQDAPICWVVFTTIILKYRFSAIKIPIFCYKIFPEQTRGLPYKLGPKAKWDNFLP